MLNVKSTARHLNEHMASGRVLTATLAKQPITGQLVRPMTRDQHEFQEAPLQSTAAGNELGIYTCLVRSAGSE